MLSNPRCNGASALAQSNGFTAINGSNGINGVEDGAQDVRPAMVKRPRPQRLNGATYRKETPLGTAYITVNSDEHATSPSRSSSTWARPAPRSPPSARRWGG